jgi:hypothetical protein
MILVRAAMWWREPPLLRRQLPSSFFSREAISPCRLVRTEPPRCPLCATHTDWNVVFYRKSGFAVAKSREMKFDVARASPVRSMSRRASSGGW